MLTSRPELGPCPSIENGSQAPNPFLRTPTLFQEDWWLDAASGGRATKLEVKWDGQTVGSLSMLAVRRYGIRRLVMPPYTRTLGPVLSLPPSNPVRQQINKRRVIHALIAQLPAHDFFFQRLDTSDDSAMAFSLANFAIGQEFTCVMPWQRSHEEMLAGCEKKTRNAILTARSQFRVEQTDDFDSFARLSKSEHSPGENANDFTLLSRIVEACLQRNCGRILVARNADDLQVASAILVHGRDKLYFWLLARDPKLKASGATIALLMHGMQIARRLRLDFDFDGYISPAVARFYAGFGGNFHGRPEVSHRSWRRHTTDFMRASFAAVPGMSRTRAPG